MSRHEALLNEAMAAADRLHGDTSVSLDESLRSLGALRDHVEMLMDAVASSMPSDAEEDDQASIDEYMREALDGDSSE